jgi:ATP-dependent Lhr-like helicase
LQSLLHRLEAAVGRQIPRIGLSATLGELSLAAEYLRPLRSSLVHIIESTSGGQELKLLVRGYEEQREPQHSERPEEATEDEPDETGTTKRRIVEDLFQVLRGTNNLVFANSRAEVESYADLLRTRCEQDRLPAEFWPHHGSLSKELREHVEELLKDNSRPVTAVCTSTLELGIDIGPVKSVAQLGSPFSVASLRQRLGRSGRRTEPAILRVHIAETCLTDQTAPVDAIRAELVQSIALIRLLLAKWCEPPETNGLHLSTLVHQILSLVAERGGILPSDAWQILCRDGPFRNVSPRQVAELLRGLGKAGMLMQAGDGTLLHAPAGEKLVNHYSFYTVFQTPEEYRLVTDSGQSLGTLPVDHPLREKMLIVFAGRRWRVLQVNERQRLIQVTRASGGKVPRFSGSGGCIHDRVRQEMRSVYQETVTPPYLDAQASELLLEGRQQFYQFGLEQQYIVTRDGAAFLFLWMGDRITNTISVQLQSLGLSVQNHGVAIQVDAITSANLHGQLQRLVDSGPADAIALARTIPNKQTEKFHALLSEDLLSADYAASRLDTTGAWQTLAKAVGRANECPPRERAFAGFTKRL